MKVYQYRIKYPEGLTGASYNHKSEAEREIAKRIADYQERLKFWKRTKVEKFVREIDKSNYSNVKVERVRK